MSVTITPAVRKKILDAAMAAERDPSVCLTVAMLAEHAGMSDKHFQRCFLAVLGESPKSYVRRLRLQIAAYLLKWSDASIVHLADGAGFETHAGFTKAFSKLYGMSPLQFRKATDLTPFLEFPREHPEAHHLQAAQSTQLAVRIQEVPDQRLAVMRSIGPTSKMATIWLKMIDWAKRRDLLHQEAVFLGIHNDYWDTLAESKYRYDAAIVVPEDFEFDDEVNTVLLPGGPVAMTEFEGSVVEADRTWGRFADQWLPVSGYQFRMNLAYDCYPVGVVTAGRVKQVLMSIRGYSATLCLPVIKKQPQISRSRRSRKQFVLR